MNILISSISAFSFDAKKQYEYEIRIDEIDTQNNIIHAYHTNESVIKCIGRILPPNESIGKLIALTTNKVETDRNEKYDNLTAFEYTSDIARFEFGKDLIIEKVAIEDNVSGIGPIERPVGEIIDDICNNISSEDVVYLDTAGGARNTINIIQILTQILKYKGIETRLSLYSNFQNSCKFITDTRNFEKLSNIASAFNEFMTSGKSTLMQNCLNQMKTNSQSYNALVKSMNEFSDNIRLGQIEKLDKTVKKLQDVIEECSNLSNEQNDIEYVILRQFLPIIKNKLIGESFSKVDYLKITDWCLENELIQQAITIFVEKIPVSLFEKKALVYTGNEENSKAEFAEEKVKNKTLPQDWETKLLYIDFLKSPKTTANANSGEQKNSLQKKFSVIEDILKGTRIPKDFKWSKNIGPAIYGYLYAKSVRNSINHASSGENLGERQKEVLMKYSYDFQHFDVKTLKKNMKIALQAIEECEPVNDSAKKGGRYIALTAPKLQLKIIGKIDLDNRKK